MTLALMQGHSGSAKAKNWRCMLSATKQTISIKLTATVGHFLRDLDLDFTNVYMACPTCFICWKTDVVNYCRKMWHPHFALFMG